MLESPIRPAMRSPLQQAIDRIGSAPAVWTPATLFAASEQGVWYDPSDFSTLFQDSAGTVPVTATGQVVGRVMDKHIDSAYQQTTGIVWTKTAGDGVLTVNGNEVTVTGATTTTQISRTAGSIPLQDGLARMVVTATWGTATGVQAWLRGSPTALTNGATATLHTPLNNSPVERLDVSTGTVTFTVTALEYWRGNHATQATTASKPTLQQDGNGKYYLAFDGVDDSMATAAVDFTATDKITFFAGVRKVDGGGFQCLCEHGTGAAENAISVFAPSAAGPDYDFRLAGAPANVLGYSPPISNVLSASYNIGGATRADETTARINGSPVTLNYVGSPVSGNFLSRVLNIGRRDGASFPLNGRIYQLIIRGALTDAAGITAAETFVNTKTAAY